MVYGLVLRIKDSGIMVWGLVFRVLSFGCRVYGCKPGPGVLWFSTGLRAGPGVGTRSHRLAVEPVQGVGARGKGRVCML